MFEHQPHVISTVRLSENKGLVAERLEVWKLPHLLGEGVRPLELTPLLCTCCRVLLSLKQKIHPDPDWIPDSFNWVGNIRQFPAIIEMFRILLGS